VSLGTINIIKMYHTTCPTGSLHPDLNRLKVLGRRKIIAHLKEEKREALGSRSGKTTKRCHGGFFLRRKRRKATKPKGYYWGLHGQREKKKCGENTNGPVNSRRPFRSFVRIACKDGGLIIKQENPFLI